MALAFHSDKALWVAFKKGNRDALDTLFRSHYPSLYQYGLKIYNDALFIEESLQNFFLHLYDRRANLADLENIKPYLFKAYRRSLIRNIENARKGRSIHKELLTWYPDISFSADELLIQKEEQNYQKEILLEILNKLPNRQREVIYLRYYDNLQISEIAEVLSISYQGTVNTIHKAIKAIRNDDRLRLIKSFISHLILLLSIFF